MNDLGIRAKTCMSCGEDLIGDESLVCSNCKREAFEDTIGYEEG